MTRSRLEAFSDGVIAIILTIMVLELKIPHEASFEALLPLLPVFICYLISFIFVGIYWGNHHHLLHTVRSVNSKLIWANMVLLFFLSLIPFTTGWLGENNFAAIPMFIYSIDFLLCSIAFYILQTAIMNGNTLNPKLVSALKKQEKKGMASLFLYIASVAISLFYPMAAAGMIIITAIIWVIPNKEIEQALKHDGPE